MSVLLYATRWDFSVKVLPFFLMGKIRLYEGSKGDAAKLLNLGVSSGSVLSQQTTHSAVISHTGRFSYNPPSLEFYIFIAQIL